MRKLNYFVDLEKEEQWLNDMARQGYILSRKSIGYEFEPAKPGLDVAIRIDYRTFRRASDFEDYRALFEDCGWAHIAGTRSSGAQYFKKTGTDTEDDIFSDLDSKAGRYKRLADMWTSLAACFIPLFVVLITTNSIDLAVFLNPKALYYTPGLWEKEGAAFWGSFLFETPFALGRGFLWMTIPIMIALASLFSYKAKKQYDSNRKPLS
ncbi:DUF2812 domain-containing protein [Paenibacillus sp. 1011MAR3C5]|uniref:DUF2812 domain-containing protein n=1 Tax=Paenibacillus sp. 1011MAR3C5 TaxID=1675787 RepID=UPI000E6CE52B|nr:DUF2812 domain-containing protein [Paenibacillus sp. 1011MAR3C5]RJE83975.1 DUF2812 domain-containing protein [Paenibacillus sp. 1011MAR3C5]